MIGTKLAKYCRLAQDSLCKEASILFTLNYEMLSRYFLGRGEFAKGELRLASLPNSEDGGTLWVMIEFQNVASYILELLRDPKGTPSPNLEKRPEKRLFIGHLVIQSI